MAESSTKNRRESARGDPRTPQAEELVEVFLRRSVGRRGGGLYGPGRTKIPRSLYESIRLSPDLVETDAAGNALPHTVAASVFGTTGGVDTEVRDAHPIPKHDEETGDLVDSDADPTAADVTRRAAALRENAELGEERQGGKLAGESGSIDDVERELHPLPGQTESSREQANQLAADRARDESNGVRSSGAGVGSSGNSGSGRSQSGGRKTASGGSGGAEAKALTKTQLRELDEDVLTDLARRNRVKVPKSGGKKALVDKLYAARVTMD